MDEERYRFVYKHYRPLEVLYDLSIFPTDMHPIDKMFQRRCGGFLFHYQRGISKWTPNTNGGTTFCFVFQGDRAVAHGIAECSIKDAFCYRIGREIAKGRALKLLGQPT
jgi:hypothetical protein